MTFYTFTRTDGPGPWDYPTLGFTATNGAVLNGALFSPPLTDPPDMYWAVGGAVESGITRWGALISPPAPAEPATGSVLVYDAVANASEWVEGDTFFAPGTTMGDQLEAAVAAEVAAEYPAQIAASVQSGGEVWKVGPTRVNVRNYGIAAANSAATNDTALAALFSAETSGVMVAFPDLGTYNFSAPLPNRSLMNIEGRGRQTVLNWTTGNVMNVTDPTLVQMATFRDLKLTNSGAAGHMFNFVGTSGGVIHTLFERCMIHPGVNGASIINAATYNLFGLTMRDCLLHRNVTATVPAFDIVGLAAAGTNNIHISGGEWHSNLCSSTPFFRFDANSPSPFINMTFMNIIGEQNVGGMIHVAGATATRVQNVIDMDVTTTYTDDIFRFTAGSGGSESNAVVIDQAGTYGSAGFSGGKYTLKITGGLGHHVGWIPKNMSQQGTVSVPKTGVTMRSVAGGEVDPWELISTTPVTMAASNHSVLYSAAGGTISLPATSAVLPGQEFRIKAIGGGGCTVSGNGANIDATVASPTSAATKTLAQYETMTVVWDGTVWRRV